MFQMKYLAENIRKYRSAKKLTQRMKRIVAEVTGITTDEAEQYLQQSDWNIRKAIALYESRK